MLEVLLDYDDSFTVNVMTNVTFQFILKKTERILFEDVYRFPFFSSVRFRCTVHYTYTSSS